MCSRPHSCLYIQVYQSPNSVLNDLVNSMPPSCSRGSKDIIPVKVLFELKRPITNVKCNCYYSISIKITHKIGV